MNTSFNRVGFFVAAVLLLFAGQRTSLAGSATWSTHPTSGDWNTTGNWKPQTVPNGNTDIATFGRSSQTNVSSESTTIDLDSLIFSSGAPPYTITLDISGYFFMGPESSTSPGRCNPLSFCKTETSAGASFSTTAPVLVI
jgi:hypothetical protein